VPSCSTCSPPKLGSGSPSSFLRLLRSCVESNSSPSAASLQAWVFHRCSACLRFQRPIRRGVLKVRPVQSGLSSSKQRRRPGFDFSWRNRAAQARSVILVSRRADDVVFSLVQPESCVRGFCFDCERAVRMLAFFCLHFPPARDFSPPHFGTAKPQFFACEQESPINLAIL
jgi:hypothetical protein